MLQAIRDKVTGWIAYGIIFLISIPFALWGVGEYFGGGELQPAATVNGEEITQRLLDQEYANYRQRLAQLFGGSIPESVGDETLLREQVLGDLIERIALRQHIEAQRYRVGDQDLNRIIWGMEVFHTDGKFDPDRYQAQLRSIGFTSEGFKQQIHSSRVAEQFQNGIVETSFVLPVVEKRYLSLRNQTRKIRSLSYRLERDAVTIDEAEIEQHYEQQALRFRSPEQIKIDYIELGLDGIKQGILVGQADSYARYQENLGAYTSPEIREASHILIKVDGDEDAAPALAQIETLRARIVNGESFADLAREHSQDLGSAADGGNLGEIERGVMVQAFEDALFALQPDQLSQPVKTSFGWHLILLHAIQGGTSQSFEAVRAQIEDEMKTELAESRIYDLVENLSNLVYEQSDSLLPAAEQLGLELKTSGWFGRANGSGIAAEQKVRAQAFSSDVLRQGLNSEAIELGPDRIVFVRLNQYQEPKQLPLDEVRDQVENELINLKLREQNQAAGSAALAELIAGKSLDQLSQEWATPVREHGFVERNQQGVDAQLLRTAFSMPRPDTGIVYEGLSLSGGDYVIIELSAVLSNDGGSDREPLDRLAQAEAGAEYEAVLQMVSNDAEVVRTPLEDL